MHAHKHTQCHTHAHTHTHTHTVSLSFSLFTTHAISLSLYYSPCKIKFSSLSSLSLSKRSLFWRNTGKALHTVSLYKPRNVCSTAVQLLLTVSGMRAEELLEKHYAVDGSTGQGVFSDSVVSVNRCESCWKKAPLCMSTLDRECSGTV